MQVRGICIIIHVILLFMVSMVFISLLMLMEFLLIIRLMDIFGINLERLIFYMIKLMSQQMVLSMDIASM